jgi:hypothetical protein
MPALFAYLIAVGLLLGGGYGALSWLAAPEPVKVSARAKPAAHSGASSESSAAAASPSEPSAAAASSPAINDHDKAAAGSNDQPPASAPDAGLAASEPSVQRPEPAPAADPSTRSANAKVLPDKAEPRDAAVEAGPSDKQPAGPALQSPPADIRSAPAAAAKAAARPRLRQARRPERGAPVLMTLRTIDYPAGRRVTRLIPYPGDGRSSAFLPDE